MTADQVLNLMRRQMARSKLTQNAYARSLGVPQSVLSLALSGRGNITDGILAGLGLERLPPEFRRITRKDSP